MSFDYQLPTNKGLALVSIPLEQGRVFRPAIVEQEEDEFLISIPLEQGRVFRQGTVLTGSKDNISIPLEQGRVFRQSERSQRVLEQKSQSL